jgi:methyltransferase family protein
MENIKAAGSILRHIPQDSVENDPQAPFWNNTWFTGLDAASLVGFLLSRTPKRYVEIGSGFSTLFCRRAVKEGDLRTTITSVDPHPRAEIDSLCDQIIRAPLEDCDPLLFDQLESGDILFFDGSHRALPNSDVTVFFLEILPRLKPGIIVQVHETTILQRGTSVYTQSSTCLRPCSSSATRKFASCSLATSCRPTTRSKGRSAVF